MRSNRLLNLQAARSWEALLQQVARQPQGARPEQLLQAAVMMVLQERHQAAAGLLQRLDAAQPPSPPTPAVSACDPVAGAALDTDRAAGTRGVGEVAAGADGGELALQRDYLRLWLLLAGVDPDAPVPSGVSVVPSRSAPQSRLQSKVRDGVAVAAGWARRCGAAEPRWRARWAAMTHTLEEVSQVLAGAPAPMPLSSTGLGQRQGGGPASLVLGKEGDGLVLAAAGVEQ
ncbi:hypothetical protein QJQ45_029859, partial [Haematococcus lacustris]